jgi:hypothetical protein
MKAFVRDRSGRIVANLEVKNNASQWTWSPLIFTSEAKKEPEAALQGAFTKNAVKDLIQQATAVNLKDESGSN